MGRTATSVFRCTLDSIDPQQKMIVSWRRQRLQQIDDGVACQSVEVIVISVRIMF